MSVMNPEIQKAVDAGKLSASAGAALDRLAPGTFVLHKSWGFGKIESVNFLVSQMTINFRAKKGHTMQLQYAAESLQPIAEDHILALKAADLTGVKARAKDDPAGLVRTLLNSYGGRATQDQIAQTLVPDVFGESEFKRWWENAKKALKKEGHFSVPAKKGEPVELREAPVSHADEYVAAFNSARRLKDQLSALDQILRNVGEFSDPSVLLAPLGTAEEQARKNQRLNPAQALEFLVTRDEILDRLPALPRREDASTIAQFLRDEEKRMHELIGDLPAAKQKRVLAAIPRLRRRMAGPRAHARRAWQHPRRRRAARLLEDQGQLDALLLSLDRAIREHSITSEVLCWLCRERDGAFADLMNPKLLGAVIGALEARSVQ